MLEGEDIWGLEALRQASTQLSLQLLLFPAASRLMAWSLTREAAAGPSAAVPFQSPVDLQFLEDSHLPNAQASFGKRAVWGSIEAVLFVWPTTFSQHDFYVIFLSRPSLAVKLDNYSNDH